VVGDARQVALATAVGDLVAADGDQAVEAALVDVVGHHALDDPPDRVPRDPEQPGDRRLGHLLGEEGDEVLEVARVGGARPGPRHRLEARPAAGATPQAAQLALDDAAARAEVEVAPALDAAVVDRKPPDLAALRADAPAAARPDRHDHPLGGERDPGHGRSRQLEHPVECGAGAHVALLMAADLRQPAACRTGGGASIDPCARSGMN
jgi:hypothetical protein